MGVDCDTEEGRLQMRMKRNERRKRDFSLRRPTHLQEQMRKKKSACSDRNDGLAGGRGEEPIGISAFPGRRTRWPVSADEWIDLVGDPIIFENNGKERSYHPEVPAPASQGAANRQALHG